MVTDRRTLRVAVVGLRHGHLGSVGPEKPGVASRILPSLIPGGLLPIFARVGSAEARLFSQRAAVDFAVDWLEKKADR